jgi:hypothetical protein
LGTPIALADFEVATKNDLESEAGVSDTADGNEKKKKMAQYLNKRYCDELLDKNDKAYTIVDATDGDLPKFRWLASRAWSMDKDEETTLFVVAKVLDIFPEEPAANTEGKKSFWVEQACVVTAEELGENAHEQNAMRTCMVKLSAEGKNKSLKENVGNLKLS